MFIFKAYLLAFFVFAATAIAGRVSYTAKYNGGKMGTQRVPIAEQYDDDKSQKVLQDMHAWSGGKYDAKKNDRTGIIIVSETDTKKVWPSKDGALTVVRDMISVVGAHYKPPSPPPSPKGKGGKHQ
ncbi:hypothetical protein F4805DRAFT_463089 [Annulohypoxylon moriforme]|nr:hypothetical protein F4805DRAFT_463089 [Annulohypoxylon moriforme]